MVRYHYGPLEKIMSRTIKGNKGPGYEYWGRRSDLPGKDCRKPGPFTKKITHRKERRIGKGLAKFS